MYYIELTRNYKVLVDYTDYLEHVKYKWCSVITKKYVYTARRVGNKMKYLHRLLTNPPENYWVDHKNGNTLDCRRENLRICTPTENKRNRHKMSKNYKGVKKISAHTWSAYIRNGGSKLYLGSFKTDTEAAYAYDTAARILHGEFAKCNF